MKLSANNTARLAVTAGLCASLTLGGLPVSAIAAELDATSVDTVVNGADEGSTGTPAVTKDESGDADEQAGAPADGDQSAGDKEAPVEDAPATASVAKGRSLGDPVTVAADAPKAEDGALEEGEPIDGWAENAEQKTVTISSAAALQEFAKKVNGGDAYQGWTISLGADIDLANVEWTPIGTSASAFKGTFDGAGHTISNLTVSRVEEENVGLFGYIASPAKLTGITVQNATVTGKASVGVIAGAAYTGEASNCTVKGDINVTGNYKVGGMFGGGYVKIDDCHVSATGSVTGTYAGTDFEGDNVGGLIGFRGEGSSITTTDCSVSGISIAGSRKVGGLVGSAFANNSYTGCSVSGVELACNAPLDYSNGLAGNQLCVGGLIGIFMKGSPVGTLSDCSVADVSFSVTDPQVAEGGKPIMGIVSGGYRASSFSGVSIPDGKVAIDGVKVSGSNTGMNADKKFPGSVAMNGTSNVFDQGTGTAEDPYIISSVEDLELFRTTVNTTGLTYEGQHLKVADGVEFDLSAEKWTSIGTSSKKFMGSFDGNGATIKGLNDGGKYSTGYSSFFGYIDGAAIKNIAFEDVNLSYSSGSKGALVSNATGSCTIDGISVSGSIVGGDSTGGVLGKWSNSGEETLTIINCTNSATVTGKGKLGGVLGYAKSDDKTPNGKVVISDCSNTGDVTPTDNGGYAGGIAGMVKFATVSNCSNEGDINAYAVAGGIIGTIQQKDSVVSDCVNNGDVAGKTFAGGIVGESSSGANTFKRCANTGDVVAGPVAPEWWSSGTPGPMAGGIVGGSRADGDAFYNCYNGGDISASTDDAAKAPFAAGITAYYSVYPIEACFNDGAVTADGGTAYQIGESKKWLQGATVSGGQTIKGCYFEADGAYYLSDPNGTTDGTVQSGMTRGQLADKLNEAGGVSGFWQPQNGTVQPDPLIPGAWDDENAKFAASVLGKDGEVRENYTSLDAAFAGARDGETVKIMDNATYARLDISDKSLTVDLNGHTLTSSRFGFTVEDGTLTLEDTSKEKSGVLQVTDNGSTEVGVVLNAGGHFVMNGGTIDSVEYGVFANPRDDNSVTVNGGHIKGAWGIAASGNKKPGCTTITVKDGVVEGTEAGISINGSSSNGGVQIAVSGGEIKATGEKSTGMYLPGCDGKTVITGGTITGATGIELRAGSLDVSGDAVIISTGKFTSEPNGNGGTTTGVGIAVAQHATKQSINLTISDDAKISGNYAFYEWNPQNNSSEDLAKIELAIKGGSFKTTGADVKSAVHSSDFTGFVSGGTFNKELDDAYLADGFGLHALPQGGYGVHEHAWSDQFESDEDSHWRKCTHEGCDAVTDPVAHAEELQGKKDATCFEDGYTGDTVCSECGYEIKKGEVIKATGEHVASKDWMSDESSHWHGCTTPGCDARLDEAGHEFGGWKVTKEATATQAGERERTCEVCGETVTEEIPALGQKPGDKPGEKPAGKPGEGSGTQGGTLAQTGDASLFGAAATGIAGALAAAAGAIARRRRK